MVITMQACHHGLGIYIVQDVCSECLSWVFKHHVHGAKYCKVTVMKLISPIRRHLQRRHLHLNCLDHPYSQ